MSVHPRRRLAALAAFLAALAACAPAPPGEVSVLLVSADSLRVDRLAPWADGPGSPSAAADPAPPPTPHLAALAARGTIYRNAWATSPWTAPSMVSVMTGLYPPSHGIAYRDDTTPPALPTLPRLLAARGYRLGNFSFFSEISYFRNLGLGPPAPGLAHATVADGFARWLGEVPAGERFFAWVHLLETHLPYGATGYRASEASLPGSSGLVAAQLDATVPVGSAAFAPGDRGRLLALYDRDVVEMDRALGRLLATLDAEGRTAGTLVVFVADHGEELLDDGWVGHASTAIEAKLRPEILRVPQLFAGPGVPAGAVRDELVQQVDVLPTLLRLLRLEAPEPLDGRPLPGLGGRPWQRREHAFFDSSPGGNLTPVERRGERLQAVTDGACVLTVHSFPQREEVRGELPVAPGAGCPPPAVERLAAALGGWRRRQTEQRLAILAAAGGGSPPSEAEAEGYAERLALVSPPAGEPLDWDRTGGQVALEWTGGEVAPDEPGRTAGRDAPPASPYWIEYRLGTPPLEVRGSFAVEQRRVVFGPVPQGFWNDLAGYSPFRLRVLDPGRRERSPWVEYRVSAAR